MDKNSAFGQLFEQGKTALDDSTSNVIDTTKKQITGSQTTQNQPNIQNSELQSQLSDESREIVNDFYAPSQDRPKDPQAQQDQAEKLQKVRGELLKLRNSLHESNYYDPLFAYERKKKEAAAQQQEEHQEEEKKMEDLQKKEQKKEDLAKFRAQRSIEIKGAVAG